MAVRQYGPVGRCIYCGRDQTQVPLSDEHIIPFFLDGPLVLPQSSCSECAAKTSAFELVCARTMFGPYRLAGNLPTRRPDQRPETLNLITHSGPDTEREEHQLTLAEYPVISAAVPELGLAGILTGTPSTEVFRVKVKILNLVRDVEARRKAEAAGKLFESSNTITITPFARLLAKIAHAFAAAELGYGAFAWFLPPLIVGEALNLPDFVGGIAELTPSDDPFVGPIGARVTSLIEHYLNCEIAKAEDGTTYLTVVIGLLQSFAPRYRVVVARYDG